MPKIWLGTFLVRSVQPGERLELILMVKIETRHPVGDHLVVNFRHLYCNHCGIMTAWIQQTWKFCEQFLRFWKNDLVW